MPTTGLYYFSLFLNMIFYPFILLVGIFLCRKYKFRGGFYFFLLLLIHQFFSMVYPLIVRNHIESRMNYQHTNYIHISLVGTVIETTILILAFLILLISLHKMFTKRDIVGELFEKTKLKVLHHKKISIILFFIFLLIITLFIWVGSSKDFGLVSAEVEITNVPSTGVTYAGYLSG